MSNGFVADGSPAGAAVNALVDLRAQRVNRGLSQAQAAREMGVDSDALARAERGVGRPHPRNALRIADFYGYKVTDIWPVPEKDAA